MPIEFDCKGCDRHMRVRDEMAGKRVKCPECEKVLVVPDAADEPEERPAPVRAGRPEPRRAAPSRPRDEDDRDERGRGRDDEDDLDPRPSRKKAKKGGSSMPLVLGIGGGVVGLGLVAFLLWFFLSGGGGGAGAVAAYIPGDAQGFVSVRLADLWKNDAVQKSIAQARQSQPGAPDPSEEMQKATGLSPQDIERVTVVYQDAQTEAMWMVVETVAPYEQAKLKGKLGGIREAAADGKSYFVGTTTGGGKAVAFHFVSDKMLLAAPEEGMKKALGASAKARSTGPLDDGLPLMTNSNHIAAAFKVPPDLARMARAGAKGGPAAQFASLAEFTSGTVALRLSSNMDLQSSLKFPDDAKAAAAKTAADAGVKMARGLLVLMGGDPKTAELAGKALDSFRADQSGSSVAVRLTVEGVGDAAGMVIPMLGQMGGVRPKPPIGPKLPIGQPKTRPKGPGKK